MKIQDLLDSGANITISVTPEDLKKFALYILQGQKENGIDLTTPINELPLSVHTKNCLRNAEINILGELVYSNREDLVKMRNVGYKSLTEIDTLLGSMGLHWRGKNV